tara:strand:- start:358 stop:606 length:249 start_codon:yes stop_codon:yes gene_type:complete
VAEFLDGIKTNPNWCKTYSHTVKTGDLTSVCNATFESEEAVINARPGMIANLDRLRNYLQEISPELGITDPVSGPIGEEKYA